MPSWGTAVRTVAQGSPRRHYANCLTRTLRAHRDFGRGGRRMMPVKVTFTWKIRGSLHIGTGMSRLGDVDRIIRLDRQGEPAIEGEQLKGAIRGSAERLIRWLGAASEPECDSYPQH